MNARAKSQAFLDPIKEAAAAKALREGVIALAGDDEDFLTDTVEGETNLFEAIDELLLGNAGDAALIKGLSIVIADMEGRKSRFEKRIEARRALIEQAMSISEMPKIERPIATLSLGARAPKVIITDEAMIPADYWKPAEPTLDKKALAEALKARAAAIAALPEDAEARAAAIGALPPEIPGATLSNAAPSLTMRSK
jgi:hypothetical protein